MITRVFEDQRKAKKAIAALEQAGFQEHEIHMDIQKQEITHAPGTEETIKAQNRAGRKWLGGFVGIFLGLVVIRLLPGVDFRPHITPILILVGFYYSGRIVGSFLGRNMQSGYRGVEEYSSPFEPGRIVVSVDAPGREDEATQILSEAMQTFKRTLRQET